MRLPLLALLSLLACPAVAGRTPGFSMSAFNTVVPSSARSAVFSPFAFELDCAMISEAFGPIEKAAYVEALGALVGCEGVYRPISERYAASATNGLSQVSARAFLVSSLGLITPKYRAFVQSEYHAGVCPVRPAAVGAESFLRAKMDGVMEDFRIPAGLSPSKGAAFIDLESTSCRWVVPFPESSVRASVFTAAGGARTEVAMMSGCRDADIWNADRFSMLRMPMADGAFFFAVLPEEGVPLDSVRGAFAAEKFDSSIAVFGAVADPSVFHGRVEVSLPRFTLDTSVDLRPAFLAFGLPLGGFKEIAIGADVTLSGVCQRTRFSLDGRGSEDLSAERKAFDGGIAGGRETRKFVCDRPFLFFVYHEPTRTVPVAGIFAGGAS